MFLEIVDTSSANTFVLAWVLLDFFCSYGTELVFELSAMPLDCSAGWPQWSRMLIGSYPGGIPGAPGTLSDGSSMGRQQWPCALADSGLHA